MKKVLRGKFLIVVMLLVLISSTSVFAGQQEYKITKVDADIETTYGVHIFNDGLMVVGEIIRGENGEHLGHKQRYLNKDGKVLNLGDYDELYDFSEGLAAVTDGDKVGYIDTTGKLVIPMDFDLWAQMGNTQAREFKNGYAEVYIITGTEIDPHMGFSVEVGDWHVIDRTGKLVDMEIKEEDYEDYEYVDPSETITILGETIKNVVFNENLALVEIQEGSNSGYYIVEKIESQKVPNTTKIKATPSTSNVMVNGSGVGFDAYLIGGNNYFKLRDLANSINCTEKQFEVSWDDKNKAINLISNQPYTVVGGEMVNGDGTVENVVLNNSKIYMDGREVDLTAYTIGANNYFKLRDIAKLFDIGITYDKSTQTVGIDTNIGYVEE